METQLVNLGRGTAQKLSCGVYPNQFVVRPLHAVSPAVGAYPRLQCYPVLRSATIRNGVPRIPPSSAQPHARPRDRESRAGSEKNLRGGPALSQLSLRGGPCRAIPLVARTVAGRVTSAFLGLELPKPLQRSGGSGPFHRSPPDRLNPPQQVGASLGVAAEPGRSRTPWRKSGSGRWRSGCRRFRARERPPWQCRPP
jgi:hypothetical protein